MSIFGAILRQEVQMFTTMLALIISHSSAGSIPALELTTELHEVSIKYHVNPELLTRIMLLESKGLEHAYNSATGDYGLMQINHRTAAAYNIGHRCLKYWKCNIRIGARILADMQKSKRYRPCAYNVGTSHIGTRMKNCLTYENKLAIL